MFYVDEDKYLDIFKHGVAKLKEGFTELPECQNELSNEAQMTQIIGELGTKMQNNYPYFHPMYAGQMLKPPTTIAQIAYYLSMFVNPNNHALDGGLASSELEKEAVSEISDMFGFDQYLGHLTSGGTIANLEALWVARNIHPDKKILVSEQAHYTHTRMCSVINTPIELVKCDDQGRIDCDALEQRIAQGDVGTVIVTLGTTGFGAIDPLDKIIALKQKYGIRIHVDSAYGGYFGLAEQLSASAQAAYECIRYVDSIVVDPHKHGMQPYGCGCVLFSDPSVGRFYKHDSPYTYFSSDQMHLGEITLECSRAGATACALWATQKLYPLVKQGEFANMLDNSLLAGKKLAAWITQNSTLQLVVEPQLDIVNFVILSDNASQSSAKAKAVFELAATENLHLALNTLDKQFVSGLGDEYWDQPNVVAVRMCLMKSEHLAWIDDILIALEKTLQSVEQ